MSCKHPAYDRNFSAHPFILAVIFSTNGAQSFAVNLLVTKGTPKYLTGNVPILNPVAYLISSSTTFEIPTENNSIFALLSCKLENE